MKNIVVPAYFTEPIIINSFADLFHLYGDLVAPVREYETIAGRKHSAEDAQSQAKNTVSSAFILPFLNAIARTLLFAIPWVIFFLIFCNVKHNADGVKWITLYDEWYGTLWLAETAKALITPESVPLWLGTILTFFHYFIIENVIAPVILFLLPLMFMVSVVTTIFSVIFAKGTIRAKQQEIEQLDAELSARLDDLSIPISLVPPDYRFSEAIDFFYRSFSNGKARDLKEAVLQYDTYAHQQCMEQGQQEILAAHNEMLCKLSYQTAQISKLEGKINSLNNKVGWL